ncbi:MAG: tRNA adenosine(34) deaminase TadA, partial [Burkholderiaceae bacterium]
MNGQGCSNNDAHWMGVALQQAQLAAERGEVPVGAVVVRGNQLVAASHNAPIALHDPTAHAEIRALRAAGQALNNYRLNDCTLYVTAEPCAMCAGASWHARVRRVVYGAAEPRTGALASVAQLFNNSLKAGAPEVVADVRAEEAAGILRTIEAILPVAQASGDMAVLRRINADQAVKVIAEANNVPAKALRTD